MANINVFDIEQYLTSAGIQYKSLERLTGGTANFVWRIVDDHGDSRIIKHAEPYIASHPSISFPLDRMDFEHKALARFQEKIPQSQAGSVKGYYVQSPEVYDYDAEQHVMTIADGGPRTLKDAYTDPEIDIRNCGYAVAAWLAKLHKFTQDQKGMFDNVTARHIYRYSYNHAPAAAESLGLDSSIVRRINDEYGSLLETEDDTVCHGDFWPGNVLLGDQALTIVDWEMVRSGCSATDVGQFAAEAWLLDRFRGNRGLYQSFLEGYQARRRVDYEFTKRVAIHMAVHISYWPTVVPWGNSEETKECVLFGHKMLGLAVEGDLVSLFDFSGLSSLQAENQPR